jgi:hypothetical protein
LEAKDLYGGGSKVGKAVGSDVTRSLISGCEPGNAGINRTVGLDVGNEEGANEGVCVSDENSHEVAPAAAVIFPSGHCRHSAL